MAQILEFLGDPGDTFRIRAYKNVSESLLECAEPLDMLVRERRLREIPGVGEGIGKKIEEFVNTGRVSEFELLKKSIPKGFFELLEIPFLGPKKLKVIHGELGVATIDELKKAIAAGNVAALPGFGEKSAQKLLEGIEIKAHAKGRRRIGEVYLTVNEIVENLKRCKEVIRVVPAGSFRRAEETVGDIDILATGKNHKAIMEYFKRQPYISKILAEGATKTSILTTDNLQVDLRVVNPQQFGSALQYFTGSKQHNVHLRTIAKNRGFKVSEYGFFKGEKLMASKTEEECYKALGMDFIAPELRTDSGEIEAAYRHELPRLIELSDIKGDLHAHSTWSDGISTIREMAIEAKARGYEYLAMTDHSPRLTVANGLTLDRLKKKKREVDALNDELEIQILFGTEVDILRDGKLDYPDEVLQQFDVVVASIHSLFEQDNTERMLRAMENPCVHIIGHPSGRLISERKPYVLDYERIFKKAAETGTVLEINGSFQRLDLQDQYIREARRFSCMFSINSDAHSAEGLWQMELGVAWARRGWCEAKDAVNTLKWEKLRKVLK